VKPTDSGSDDGSTAKVPRAPKDDWFHPDFLKDKCMYKRIEPFVIDGDSKSYNIRLCGMTAVHYSPDGNPLNQFCDDCYKLVNAKKRGHKTGKSGKGIKPPSS
jgi:hypothetical protein